MRNAETFGEFWPEYVRAHSEPGTRGLHLGGTLAGWGILLAALVTRHWWWIVAALVVPYALAWIGHFFVEHNKPATFDHPLWSWWADQKMVGLMMVGKMTQEVEKASEGGTA
jgi:hypothetical protein